MESGHLLLRPSMSPESTLASDLGIGFSHLPDRLVTVTLYDRSSYLAATESRPDECSLEHGEYQKTQSCCMLSSRTSVNECMASITNDRGTGWSICCILMCDRE